MLAGLLLLAALVYAGDYLSVRVPIPPSRAPFSSVSVTPEYVIHEKNGKVEYQFAEPVNQPCVNSLFPHFGQAPCWYLRRHAEKQIEI